MKKKLTFVLAALLILCVTVGGAIAWLSDESGAVQNTFTVGKIEIELDEDNVDENNTQSFDMIPGVTYSKKPYVTVKGGSEACWLFIQVTEEPARSVADPTQAYAFSDFITYQVYDGWTKLDGETNVYYRELDSATAADTTYEILAGNSVAVPYTVTEQMMDHLKTGAYTQPKLIFTAYAVQHLGFDNPVDAWAEVKP